MRLQLKDWENQQVYFSGRALEWDIRGEEYWLLLKNVRAALHEPDLTGDEMEAKAIKIDHMWVILNTERMQKVQMERLNVFGCCGRPYQYARGDGSIDWAIHAGKFINTDAAIVDFNNHVKHKRVPHALAIIIAMQEAWFEEGLPLCNGTQSTNDVLMLLDRYIRQFKNAGWLADTREMRRKYQRAAATKKTKIKSSAGFG